MYKACVLFLAVVGLTLSSELGDPCTVSSQCLVEDSHCYFSYGNCDRGECTCVDNFYEFNSTTCRPAVKISEPCFYDSDCEAMVRYAECGDDDACKCHGQQQIYEDIDGTPYCYLWKANERCLQANYTKCLTYRLTPEYGICDENCTCENTKLDGERCVPYDFDDFCDGQDICASNSECLNNTCSCPQGSTWSDTFTACVSTSELIRLGLQQGEQCNTNEVGLEESSVRACKPWLQCETCPGEFEDTCVLPQARLDEITCVNDDNCTQSNSYCHFEYTECEIGQCKCSEGYYLANDETCRRAFSFEGEPCEIDEDCTPNLKYGFCDDDGLCRCEQGESEPVNGVEYCYESLMGDQCDSDDQCLSWRINDNGFCNSTSNRCGCKEAYKIQGEECVAAGWRDSCDLDVVSGECQSDLVCTDTGDLTCECPSGTRWDYSFKRCVSSAESVITDLVAGETCNLQFEFPEAKLCKPWLKCDACPDGGSEDYVCQKIDKLQDIDLNCTTDADCTEDNSHCAYLYEKCSTGQCRCNDGYYISSEYSCAKALLPGEVCTSTEECHASVAYSRCNENNVCSCNAGEETYEHEGKRYCYKYPAGAYAEDGSVYNCLTYRLNPSAGALDNDGNCTCRDDYILEGQLCKPVYWNKDCSKDILGDMQCIGGTVCVEDAEGDKTCQCPDSTSVWDVGYEQCVNHLAQKNLGENELCNSDYDSSDGLLCDPLLRCARCSSEDPRTCKTKVSGRCSSDADCKNNNTHCALPYFSCEFGTCECDENYYAVSESECRKGGTIGEPCELDEDCLAVVSNSSCVDKVCQCSAAEDVYELDGQAYCYLKAAGELCNEADDCLTYRINPDAGDCISTSVGSLCLCSSEYIMDGQTCTPAYYGENCDVDGTLERKCEGNSECNTVSGGDKVCECQNWQKWNYFSNKCVSNEAVRNRPGESCDRLNQICMPWLRCDSCPFEDEENLQCQVYNDDIDPTCYDNGDCSTFNTYCAFEFEDCPVGKCKCLKDHYFSSDMFCKPAKRLGEQCDTTEDCKKLFPHSYCTEEKMCACREGELMYDYNGKSYCYKRPGGEPCHWSLVDECLTYRIDSTRAACRDTGDGTPRCDCKTSYLLMGEACVVVPYGEECRYDNKNDRLCVESTECRDDEGVKKCLCPDNHAWDSQLELCVHEDAETGLEIGEECNDEYDSSGQLCKADLVCGKCNQENSTFVCHPPTGAIGGVCSSDGDCRADNSFCSLLYEGCNTGVCSCVSGFFPPVGTTMTCSQVKYLGDDCTDIEECRRGVAYSRCEDNVCTCGDQESEYSYEGKDYCYLAAAGDLCYYSSDCLTFRIDSDAGDCLDETICGCRDNYILEGEVCVKAQYDEPCVIDGLVKECEDNFVCLIEEEICRCSTTNSTYQQQYDLCINNDADTDLPEGEECNTNYESPEGLICQPDLECAICQEKGQVDEVPVCQIPLEEGIKKYFDYIN